MKKLIVFIDSGDTLIQERTERRDARGVVQTAELAPGAKEAILTLCEKGYTVALVADGDMESFRNMYTLHGIWDCFKTKTVSRDVGEQKPSEKMFRTAMASLGLTDADIPRIVMIGNNPPRDILGANNMGITSVLMRWSDRYSYTPAQEMEKPDYTLYSVAELVPLMDKLEDALANRACE